MEIVGYIILAVFWVAFMILAIAFHSPQSKPCEQYVKNHELLNRPESLYTIEEIPLMTTEEQKEFLQQKHKENPHLYHSIHPKNVT